MIHLEFAKSFASFPAEALVEHGVGRVTVDYENIFVAYARTQIFPGAARNLDRMRSLGVKASIVTNCGDAERLERSAEILGREGLHLSYKGKVVDGYEEPLRPKPHEDLFTHALEQMGQPEVGDGIMHCDDQLKGFVGANAAGFDYGVWTYPEGRQHPGVLLFRPVEVPIGGLFIVAQRLQGMRPLGNEPSGVVER